MKEKKLKVVVAGIEMVIDYNEEVVLHFIDVPQADLKARRNRDEIVKRTNRYLLDEGFLDDSFIQLQKQRPHAGLWKVFRFLEES